MDASGVTESGKATETGLELKTENNASHQQLDDDNQRETTGLCHQNQFGIEDYNFNLLTDADNSVYNDCTVPLNENTSSISNKNHIPTVVSNSDSTTPLTACDGGEFTVVDLDRNNGDDGAQVKFTNKSTVHGDMMQSINSLRLNVNNHIIGGSKNVMGRMRKLSISDLNRRGRTTSRKTKIAFYAALIALSLLFLYLIYQNLFNDR